MTQLVFVYIRTYILSPFVYKCKYIHTHQAVCLHMKIYRRFVCLHVYTFVCLNTVRWQLLCINNTYRVNIHMKYKHGLLEFDAHDLFTCSTWFSSLYLWIFQPQIDCPVSLHINHVEAVNHSCGWSGGSVRPGLWCGYGCCDSQSQDVTLAVCGDAVWTEWFPGSRWRTGVSKAEFAARADHHYCTGLTISHTDI